MTSSAELGSSRRLRLTADELSSDVLRPAAAAAAAAAAYTAQTHSNKHFSIYTPVLSLQLEAYTAQTHRNKHFSTYTAVLSLQLHRARLVLGWVTAFRQVNCLTT